MAWEPKKVELHHGERFGKLTVLKKLKSHDGRTLYRCGCECGSSTTIISARKLMSGERTACHRCQPK